MSNNINMISAADALSMQLMEAIEGEQAIDWYVCTSMYPKQAIRM